MIVNLKLLFKYRVYVPLNVLESMELLFNILEFDVFLNLSIWLSTPECSWIDESILECSWLWNFYLGTVYPWMFLNRWKYSWICQLYLSTLECSWNDESMLECSWLCNLFLIHNKCVQCTNVQLIIHCNWKFSHAQFNHVSMWPSRASRMNKWRCVGLLISLSTSMLASVCWLERQDQCVSD